MSKTATINLRVDPEFKSEVEALYESFGISVTDAINMFLHVSLMAGGLPFELRKPHYNAETLAAMQEYEDMKQHPEKYKRYASWAELQAELDAEPGEGR
ncbi:MAG: type II toxin-antitoxin system RelB/DinJ family antitoxin [Peptoniphilaceae bacterium]|nr:type II toxin-antitoxin system RelB/DinJ family antitoxin [Peptoniphilaceae bacterium]MDY6086099.1 type II toxin-antitoxin system RelB/DinJ family antitoxin [Peptoniphilaceae bacterium]